LKKIASWHWEKQDRVIIEGDYHCYNSNNVFAKRILATHVAGFRDPLVGRGP